MSAINRETLLKIINLVKPALATSAYIPALTHIRFDGKSATSFNDVTSIKVRAEIEELEECVPGELLLKALNSFSAETITVKDVDDNHLVFSSGRSKLKIPVLPLTSFPTPYKSISKGEIIELDAAILKGVERCLMSVGNDPTHPAQMGVTLDTDTEGKAILYSTDNFSISRFCTNSKVKLAGDSPVILPTFFCQQMLSLAKAFPDDEIDLLVGGDCLVARFGKAAELFTKVLADLEPLDFARIVDRSVKVASLKKQAAPLPPQWDSAFSRALLVLGDEVDKVTEITASDDKITLSTTSPLGEADDTLGIEGMDLKASVMVDPALIVRGSKSCSKVLITDKVTALCDDDAQFIHLIAHCSK